MMPLSPTEDIRAARRMLAARFGNDLDRIVADCAARNLSRMPNL